MKIITYPPVRTLVITLGFSILTLGGKPFAMATEDDPPFATGGVPTEPSEEGVVSRTIVIRPKAAKPTVTSNLFPSREKLKPGNAAPIFLRNNFEAKVTQKNLSDLNQTDYFTIPIESLDAAAIQKLWPFRMNELRRAAFRENAGWEYPVHEEQYISIILPDLQETRSYVKALVLFARLDLKAGNIADATDKICIALGLSKHIGETPFMISKLVQGVNTNAGLFAIEEMLQHPQSENLYWELTSFPRPMIDVRSAIQFESAWIQKSFAKLNDLDSMEKETSWQRLAGEIYTILEMSDSERWPKKGTPEYAEAMRNWLVVARKRLPSVMEVTEEELQRMGDAEVSVRYWNLKSRSLLQEQLAWALLPFHQAIPRSIEVENRIRLEHADELPIWVGVFNSHGFVQAAARLEQRIDLLRVIEAIRHWSEKNNGSLPPSLESLDLPISKDCATDKPFDYAIGKDGRSATLTGAKIGSMQMQYELTLD